MLYLLELLYLSVHLHMFTSLQYSDIFTGCLPDLEFPVRLHASVSTPSSPPSLFISLTFYICTLLLDLFAPVLTPASLKFQFISARQKVIVLSLSLVLLSGIRCHCTLEMLYIDTFKSAVKPISSTFKNRISSYLPDFLCVSVCVVCVCGGWDGERERGRESVCNRCDCASMYWCIIMQSLRETFV